MTRGTHIHRSHCGTTGFTLIEAVMSMLIVGLMLVASLNTVGASKLAQSRNAEQTLGPMLARELMAEILNQAYEEPVDTAAFGLEGEAADVRADWDDVDDYHGWSAMPPQNRDGSAVTGADGWTRTVSVTWVNKLTFNPSGGATGLKRIDVEVVRNGRIVTTLSSLRTCGWPDEGGAAQQAAGPGGGSNQSPTTSGEDFFKSLFK
jgi:type II secretory pathway pseudopilin PulG